MTPVRETWAAAAGSRRDRYADLPDAYGYPRRGPAAPPIT
jgi:hypothetical protein